MRSPFLDLPGAVAADAVEAPAHYGNPALEQRRLAEGRAIVDLADRVVIEVAGADRLTWLDSITSQAMKGLQPGQSTELLILDPQGHLEHAAAVVDDGSSAWLIVDRDDAPGLIGWLKRMVFRSAVTVDERPEFAVVGFEGDADARALVTASTIAPQGTAVVWVDPWVGVLPGGHQYAVGEHPGAERAWIEAVVPLDELAALAERIDDTDAPVVAAGLLAAEALRIAAWRPRWSREVDEKTLPHELDWLRTAVHLNKGCYRGQETVAKVHNLGHPPRRIVFLQLDGSDSDLPGAGAVIFNGETEVGRVTSSARHHELGPIALAVVKRALAVDVPLTVVVSDGDEVVLAVAAAQEVIVPRDAGAEASVPRLPRIGARARA